jgi:hypothetical protein
MMGFVSCIDVVFIRFALKGREEWKEGRRKEGYTNQMTKYMFKRRTERERDREREREREREGEMRVSEGVRERKKRKRRRNESE